MSNSKQSNKRAVTRFTALFICMILFCGIALPLFVFADTVTIKVYKENGRYYSFKQYGGSNITLANGLNNINVEYNAIYQCQCFYRQYVDQPYKYYAVRYTTNGYTYYNLSYDYNNPTIIQWNENVRIQFDTNSQNNVGSTRYYFFKIVPSGYTLTFNSQGGSSISPLTGVSGIVHLGESGQYNPEYVPTKHGYEFIGWSLTENGTVVWDVDVQADTTLYARWRMQNTYREITFGEGFYEDPECTEDIAGALVLYNTEIVVYTNKMSFAYPMANPQNKWRHFYGNITLTRTDGAYESRNLQGHSTTPVTIPNGSYVYEYRIVVDKNYHVECNFANQYTYQVKFVYNDYETMKNYIDWYIPQQYGMSIVVPVGNWWLETNTTTYLTDDVLGIHDAFKIQLPYVMFSAKITVPDNLSYANSDIIISSNVVEDNSEYHASNIVYIDANPAYDVTDLDQNIFPLLTINCKSITDYDITQDYHPLIIYDESTGEASWGFEEVSLLDTNWNTISDNVPYKMNHIWDGIFSLSGLAVLIPLVMMVSFTMWFIRRS